MQRFSNSLALAKSSWAVLKADKELIAIPVASFFATLVVTVLMGGAVFFSLQEQKPGTLPADLQPLYGDVTTSGTTLGPTPVTYFVGVLAYLLITFVVTFFAAALVAGAYQRLIGGDATLGRAFGVAGRRVGPILLWSLLAGTVGLALSSIESRAPILGRIVGMAWKIVIWMAIPVIVVEGTNPIPSLKRSASLFRRTWGENLIAQGGLGLLSFLALAVGVVVSGAIATVVPMAGLVLLVIWVAVTTTVIATLNGIFRTALYLHAAGHQVQWFDEQTLAGAFRPRTSILTR